MILFDPSVTVDCGSTVRQSNVNVNSLDSDHSRDIILLATEKFHLYCDLQRGVRFAVL